MANYKIEPLGKNNYETWCIQAQAVLTRNGLWKHISGSITSKDEDGDLQAKSELLLLICPSEIKQVKNCKTSADIWNKLKSIYDSKGPAKRASLLKQLLLSKLTNDDQIKDHLKQFMETADKLAEMDIQVHDDILTFLMLYSLSPSYDNFRVAIETRDVLPKPEELKIKIIEESESRKHCYASENTVNVQQEAFYGQNKEKRKFKFCTYCKKGGHTITDCYNKPSTSQNKNATRNNKGYKNNNNSANLANEKCLSSLNNKIIEEDEWVLDSGCTSHMTKNRDYLHDMQEIKQNLSLASDNFYTEIKGKGTVTFKVPESGHNLFNSLYVPSLNTNLMSVGKSTSYGNTILFRDKVATVKNAKGKITMRAFKREDGLYYITPRHVKAQVNSSYCNNIMEWHQKLGHANEQDLKLALKNNKVQGMAFNKNDKLEECEACIKGKMTKTTYKSASEPRTNKPLQIVHSDLCGPMRVPTHAGNKYFITFIDDFSRYSRVYFMKQKNEALKCFKIYKEEMENVLDLKIKCLQTDNGKEYLNEDFQNYLNQNGIRRRLSCPYTSEQNGLAERKNRTLQEKARTMLIESKAPEKLWGQAIYTANYLSNRCINKSINNDTPFEKWVGRVPSGLHLHIFGQKAFVLNKRYRTKFEPKASVGMFAGYSEQSKAYLIYLPKTDNVVISRDVRIVNKMYFATEDSTNKEQNIDEQNFIDVFVPDSNPARNVSLDMSNTQLNTESDNDSEVETHTSLAENAVDGIEPRQSSERIKKLPIWSKDYVMKTTDEIVNDNENDYAYLCDSDKDESDSKWHEAIKAEFKAHLKNGTWKIIDKEEGMNIVTNKIILKEKYTADGKVERLKARLVARGFNQMPGIDFDETYSPVSKLSSIRMVMANAIENNLNIEMLDVTTAFLNGDLHEKIYMKIPDHMQKILCEIIQNDEEQSEAARIMLQDLKNNIKKPKVCLLQKALYGLKQAPRQWFEKLDSTLKALNFFPSYADPCVYRLNVKGGEEDIINIAIYVDDIIVTFKGNKWNDVKQRLLKTFCMRELKVDQILGIKIEYNKLENTLKMSQSTYIKKLLKTYGMEDCKPSKTPMEPGTKFLKGPAKAQTNTNDYPYQNLIGGLMYLAVATRPDISYAVSYMSQFNNCYTEEHYKSLKRILRYLKGTIEMGITYRRAQKPIEGFSDANWATCEIDRRSYSGYCFTYASGIVSWESKKQRTVALSTAESEYMALTEAAKEAMYLLQLCEDLGIDQKVMVLYNDNQAAQQLARNPIVDKRSKHIQIRRHFIKEKVSEGFIKLQYKRTDELEADMFTKALPGPSLIKIIKNLGLDP